MFELIGLAFATFVLFAFATIVGAMYAGVAWFLLRTSGRGTPRLPIITVGFLPIICAVYFCLFHIGFCAFVTPAHESVFGDISEPLPNGYTFTGLAKMSDYCYIDVPPRLSHSASPPGDIGRLAVQDSLVFASISRPFGEPTHTNDERGFFALNTATGQVTRFDALSQMVMFAGRPINLVPSGIFRTQDRSTLLVRQIGTILLLGPPTLALLFSAGYLIRCRSLLRSNKSESVGAV